VLLLGVSSVVFLGLSVGAWSFAARHFPIPSAPFASNFVASGVKVKLVRRRNSSSRGLRRANGNIIVSTYFRWDFRGYNLRPFVEGFIVLGFVQRELLG